MAPVSPKPSPLLNLNHAILDFPICKNDRWPGSKDIAKVDVVFENIKSARSPKDINRPPLKQPNISKHLKAIEKRAPIHIPGVLHTDVVEKTFARTIDCNAASSL